MIPNRLLEIYIYRNIQFNVIKQYMKIIYNQQKVIESDFEGISVNKFSLINISLNYSFNISNHSLIGYPTQRVKVM